MWHSWLVSVAEWKRHFDRTGTVPLEGRGGDRRSLEAREPAVARELVDFIANEIASQHMHGTGLVLRELLQAIQGQVMFRGHMDSISSLWRFLKAHSFCNEKVDKYEGLKDSVHISALRKRFLRLFMANE